MVKREEKYYNLDPKSQNQNKKKNVFSIISRILVYSILAMRPRYTFIIIFFFLRFVMACFEFSWKSPRAVRNNDDRTKKKKNVYSTTEKPQLFKWFGKTEIFNKGWLYYPF